MKKIILCILLVNCISCENNNETEKKVETLSHDNGLVISIDENVSKITRTSDGFKVNLADEGARAINELELKKSNNSLIDLSSYSIKTIDGTDYYFKLETVSEGSGGDEYILKIWKPSNEGGIFLEHYIQQESKPVFEKDWDNIQNVNQVKLGSE